MIEFEYHEFVRLPRARYANGEIVPSLGARAKVDIVQVAGGQVPKSIAAQVVDEKAGALVCAHHETLLRRVGMNPYRRVVGGVAATRYRRRLYRRRDPGSFAGGFPAPREMAGKRSDACPPDNETTADSARRGQMFGRRSRIGRYIAARRSRRNTVRRSGCWRQNRAATDR